MLSISIINIYKSSYIFLFVESINKIFIIMKTIITVKDIIIINSIRIRITFNP